ncbi:MAG: hypothetical protein LBU14_03550 [Candidatus Peribacteria bacterium]|nr:hypothetical protein [Candidatus Peribacteria bacterium]
MSATHLSIFDAISAHLTIFQAQTTTHTQISFFINSFIVSQTSSIILKSNQNHCFQASTSPEIFKSTFIDLELLVITFIAF